MPSRRNQIEMSASEVESFLGEQRVINIATIDPHGYPHVVAMWFVVVDGEPTFWTFGKSQKVANLRRDSRITGLVESGEAYSELRGVELVGRATIIDDPDRVLEIGKAVAVKYNGPAAAEGPALGFLEAQARKRVGVAIAVERTVSWDHSKIQGY